MSNIEFIEYLDTLSKTNSLQLCYDKMWLPFVYIDTILVYEDKAKVLLVGGLEKWYHSLLSLKNDLIIVDYDEMYHIAIC